MGKRLKWIILTVLIGLLITKPATPENFQWGNGYYYDLAIGEQIPFQNVEVELLQVSNHYNQVRIGEDTVWLKVARRSMPEVMQGIRVFVADNRTLKGMADNPMAHALLTKDALICLSDARAFLLDTEYYRFPVSFNDGFTWHMEEENSFFSSAPGVFETDSGVGLFAGVILNLQDAPEGQRHWMVAIENCRVVWIEKISLSIQRVGTAMLLQSERSPEIYYLYAGLDPSSLQARRGERMKAGDLLGRADRESDWERIGFSIIHSREEPAPENFNNRLVNGFPQLAELFRPGGQRFIRSFPRGKFSFGLPGYLSGGRTGIHAYEPYAGRGWILGNWNPADIVERVTCERRGNVRLRKVLFSGTVAHCVNPDSYFDYRINVPNGVYRVRIRVGDMALSTVQTIEFNGIPAGTKVLKPGEFDWTSERVVNVTDGKLMVRISPGPEDSAVAGVSEIVFQKVYHK